VRYPKISHEGGAIIRSSIKLLRQQGVSVPLNSHILIATSAGSDSVALAHILSRYGRRLVGRGRVSLLHINHGWRKGESQKDEQFVKRLATELGVGFIFRRLKPPEKTGCSWEEVARRDRKKIFLKLSHEKKAFVITAHHADDLAETLIWRLFTGSFTTHGGGILVKDGNILRPFLSIRKKNLIRYLKSEDQSYRFDCTNSDPRFLRNRIRSEIMRPVEKIFPKATEHLVKYGIACQSESGLTSSQDSLQAEAQFAKMALFRATGLNLRRNHWKMLEVIGKSTEKYNEVSLPGGWKLKKEKGVKESWILEK